MVVNASQRLDRQRPNAGSVSMAVSIDVGTERIDRVAVPTPERKAYRKSSRRRGGIR
jgi:hypothetical protein